MRRHTDVEARGSYGRMVYKISRNCEENQEAGAGGWQSCFPENVMWPRVKRARRQVLARGSRAFQEM